jgi:hypothetical protein
MNAYFERLRQNLELNPSFDEMVQTRHRAVRSVFGDETTLIGSLQRRTRIQPRQADQFDIDILVVLGSFDRWLHDGTGISATQALNSVYQSVANSDRYSAKNPQQESPTVSLTFAGSTVKVELVPAYRDNVGVGPGGQVVPPKGRGYWIPNPHGAGWVHADYDFDAEYITSRNTNAQGYLVPAIKMLKAIKRKCFPALSSFGLEILAAEIVPPSIQHWRQQSQPITWDSILLAFFDLAPSVFAGPLVIPGSNSTPVVLSEPDRQAIIGKCQTLATYIRTVYALPTQALQIEGWRGLFDDAFPTRV